MVADDWLEDLGDPDPNIDELIEQITVDAYGDEGYWSFRQAFEDHNEFPMRCSIDGTEVTITEIDFDDERRGLTATVQRDGHTSTVSLLDLDIPAHPLRLTRLIHGGSDWTDNRHAQRCAYLTS